MKKNKDGKIELAVAVSKGIQKVQIPDLTNSGTGGRGCAEGAGSDRRAEKDTEYF